MIHRITRAARQLKPVGKFPAKLAKRGKAVQQLPCPAVEDKGGAPAARGREGLTGQAFNRVSFRQIFIEIKGPEQPIDAAGRVV